MKYTFSKLIFILFHFTIFWCWCTCAMQYGKMSLKFNMKFWVCFIVLKALLTITVCRKPLQNWCGCSRNTCCGKFRKTVKKQRKFVLSKISIQRWNEDTSNILNTCKSFHIMCKQWSQSRETSDKICKYCFICFYSCLMSF